MATSSPPAEVFISYAHEDVRLRHQLDSHLKLLQREGVIDAWHDRQIVAGTEWQGQIDAHLNSAHLILLLISPDFLASDYCYDVELRRAMQRHNAGEARVIPVILRPVDNWEHAPFGKLQSLPKDGKPIAEWRIRDRAFAEVARGIRESIDDLGHARRHPHPKNRRQRMLTRVRRTWIDGFLEQSLHGAALQAIGLQERPEAIPDRWDMVVQRPDHSGRILPPDTTIVQVFDDDDVDGELLILGEPGSGKTTLLLELTRSLLDRAEQYEMLPIPVVFPLAPWAAKRLPLADWLVDELNQRYDIPQQIGRGWVTNGQILPLLDGLDEVAAEHRVACVAAVNAYRQSRKDELPGLVVTSRVVEYDALSTQLRLRGSVLLNPLRAEQIDAYLASAGEQLAGVRAALHADDTLRELAASPLLLSTMTLAYQGAPADVLPTSGSREERRAHLFATYVDQMLRRRGVPTRYSRQQTLHWLGWLATTLTQQAQTVFYMERLQPDWLATQELRWRYSLVDRSGGLLIGLLGGLLVRLVYGLTFKPFTAETGGLFYGLLVGLVGALFGGTDSAAVIDGLSLRAMLRRGALGSLVGALAGGLVLGLIEMTVGVSYVLGPGVLGWLLGAAGYVLIGGLVGGLAGALVGGPAIRPRRIAIIETIHGSMPRARSSGIVGLIVGLVVGLFTALASRLTPDPDLSLATTLADMLVTGLVFGLVFGLIGAVVGGEVEAKIAPNQGITRSARTAVLAGLVCGFIGGAVVGLVSALVAEPAKSLSAAVGVGTAVGLSIGLLVGLVLGGHACLSHYALRLVLWRRGALPLDTIRFLDYATERIFLRKVGGGYIFVHRLLQEYFASQGTAAHPIRQPAHPPLSGVGEHGTVA